MGPTRKNKPAIRRRGYGDRPFRLSLRHLDSGEDSPWPFHDLSDQDITDLGLLLANVIRLSWDDIELIKDGSGYVHGYRTVSDLSRAGYERFSKLPQEVTDQEDSLFRFKVTTDKRIWGFVLDDIFYVLWWDPRHQVGRDRNA